MDNVIIQQDDIVTIEIEKLGAIYTIETESIEGGRAVFLRLTDDRNGTTIDEDVLDYQ